MRISTKLGAMVALMIAVLGTMLPLLAWTYTQSTLANDDALLADAIQLNFFDRAALRDHWLLHRDSLTLKRWQENKATSDGFLRRAEAQFLEPDDQNVIRMLRQNIDESAAILERLARNNEVLKGSVGNRSVYEDLDTRLASQLLLKATTIRDQVTALDDAVAGRMQEKYRQLVIIVSLLAVTMAFATIFGSLHLVRLIRKRLVPLHDGAGRIADGDLNWRLQSGGSDEFGDLGHAFNRMAEKLQSFTQNLQAEISAHSQTEQALRDSEIRYRNLLEDQTEIICRFKADGNIIYANEAFCRFFGKARDSLLGRSWQPEAVAEDVTLVMEKLQSLTPMNPVAMIENRVVAGNGEIRWCQFANRAIFDDTAAIIEVQSVGRDITERKRVEAELAHHRQHLEDLVAERTLALTQAKELAEAANRAKSTFLATMSHELRTPLNAIMGMTELAQKRATDAKQRDQLDKVSRASRTLLAIIKDVLDLSRIEAERLKLEHTEFALLPVMDNVDELMRGLAAEKGLTLRMDIEPAAADLDLCGDSQRLGQILINLVGNAIKFTKQGHITVSAKIVDENPTEAWLRFEVQDTGIGIATEDQQRLFLAFEQVDGTSTRKYGGTGLGLVISKRLVEMMQGSIGVHSEPGAGSTFWFTAKLTKASAVPAPAADEVASKPRARLQSGHAGAYLLLAEDDPLNQEIAQGLLEEVGLVVHLAADGAKAVEMAKRVNYDLILMDVQMPNLDGLEATRQIRQSTNNPQVPIIALTANVFPEDEAHCREAGMNDFVGRPVETEVLYAAVLKWLARSGEQLAP